MEHILENSLWNDDLKTWKLPNDIENNLKLPPATLRSAFHKRNVSDNKKLNSHLEDVHNRLDSTEFEESTVSIYLYISNYIYYCIYICMYI